MSKRTSFDSMMEEHGKMLERIKEQLGEDGFRQFCIEFWNKHNEKDAERIRAMGGPIKIKIAPDGRLVPVEEVI